MINGTGDGGASFAVNLGDIPEWEEPVFIDQARQARRWVRADYGSLAAEHINADRELVSLPAGQTQARIVYAAFDDPPAYRSPPPSDRLKGRYRLTITSGAATVDFSDVGPSPNVTQIDANTWEFNATFGLNSLIFTPSAYPLRFSMVRASDLTKHAAGQIYRDEFLDFLPSGGCFRFMDWMSTNNSLIEEWAQYTQSTSMRFRPVPFSAMVQLCALKNADGWFNIPPRASDAFVTQMATYLRDNFPVSKRIRIELGNEIWNTGTFSHALYYKALAEAPAPAGFGVADGYSGGAWMHAYGKRFAQCMQIFNSVFAGQTHRVIGVIGGQVGSTFLADAACNASLWLASDPANYVQPATLAKEFSVAPYINWTGSKTTHGNNIKAALDSGGVTAATDYIKALIAPGLADAKVFVQNDIATAVKYNLRLTYYEYNEHFDTAATSGSTLYSGGNPVAGAVDAFRAAAISSEMLDAIEELRNWSRTNNVSLMTFFNSTGRWTQFGQWGAKTHLGDENPKWGQLTAWHAANPRWWAQ